MFSDLQIGNSGERAIVGVVDIVLGAAARVCGALGRPAAERPPSRVLLLRLERIGDLLMVVEAIASIRSLLPDARIDLAVGGWNAPLAALLPHVTEAEVLNAPWLTRGETVTPWLGLITHARGWRARRYDLVVNFEPDIRSNFLAWLSGAPRRVGYWTGGGGAFLTDTLAYDPRAHVSINALRLAAHVTGGSISRQQGPMGAAALAVPAQETARARALLAGHPGPWIGLHASGGRAVKTWPVERFRELAARLIAERGAAIVLTGSAVDRQLVRQMKAGLPADRVLDVSGDLALPGLAALLQQLDVFITGDTGPMHLADAVGTPVVAIFGPSDPARYGPRGPHDRIVRIDLPCSPCNRIRLPPARCTGHTPDCLAGIQVSSVLEAADDVLRSRAGRARAQGGHG